jgi:hypothetical protein
LALTPEQLRCGNQPPSTQAETELARIWCEVLDMDSIGRHDDFFALGGHSLMAMRVMARVRRQFGVELGVSVLFDHPELADFARAVTDAAHVSQSTGGAEPGDGG